MPKPASTGLIRIRFELYKCSANWQTERARSRRAGPLFQYATEPGDFYGQNDLFLSTRHRSPVDRSLVAKALNPSLFRHACRMAISRNACSLLDFPEFAQAVGYGVPGTRCINETLPWYYPGTEEAHTNPTRQRGECLRALAGASG